jgi:hypothetical protein
MTETIYLTDQLRSQVLPVDIAPWAVVVGTGKALTYAPSKEQPTTASLARCSKVLL